MEKSVNNKILEVKNLKKYFPVTRGVFRKKVADVKAVDDISFHIKKGETLGLVGESGCGKTTAGRCVQRMYEPTAGEIIFEGKDIAKMTDAQIMPFRNKLAVIFQDPYSSLDPRMKAGTIVGEPLKIYNIVDSKQEYIERVEELFKITGLNPSMTDRFPHEFSGGQRQRLSIARALAGDPSLMVCDEPLSALDVSIQAQIIELFQKLQDENDELTYLFISHDLLVVQYISDRIAVMYLGKIMEIANSKELYDNTLHPYSKALLSAIPIPDPFIEEGRERIILEGNVPSPLNPPSGCPFHPRCPIATDECSEVIPQLKDVGNGHQVACIKV